jgi:uncharacterized protein YndB with AHSA1/START domain
MAKDRVNNEETIRHLDAPRELVFSLFTDPGHLVRWWRPEGFKMVYCKLDLRPGGMIHYCARSPEGRLLWGRFEFREIRGLQRTIFMHSFAEGEEEKLGKVILTETSGGTIVTITAAQEYGSDLLDQLENYLFTITEKAIHHAIK